MGQVIKIWNDCLCSKCYSIIALNSKADYADEPEWCNKCNEHVFPIVIMTREYNTELAIGANCQAIERDIKHGVEIIHIDGEGIIESCQQNLARKDEMRLCNEEGGTIHLLKSFEHDYCMFCCKTIK